MINKLTLDDVLKLAGLVLLSILVFRSCNPEPVIVQSTDTSKIEQPTKDRIAAVEHQTNVITTRIIQSDKDLVQFDSIYKVMQYKLDSIKQLNDCAKESAFKDTIIEHDQENKALFRYTIAQRDSVIQNQKFIISAKDTLLGIKDSVVKDLNTTLSKTTESLNQVKRQRNGLIGLSILEAILLGFALK